jgi:hypothetical protein
MLALSRHRRRNRLQASGLWPARPSIFRPAFLTDCLQHSLRRCCFSMVYPSSVRVRIAASVLRVVWFARVH